MADDSDFNFDLPRPMRDALHDLHRGPAVPAEVDERILFAARDGFARRQRTRMMIRRTAAVGGAVAAAVAVFFGVHAMRPPQVGAPAGRSSFATSTPISGDVDRSGRVDIVDAFVLAKKLETGEVPWQSYEDLDRDGKVTKTDVDRVAQLAVTLPDGDLESGGTIQ